VPVHQIRNCGFRVGTLVLYDAVNRNKVSIHYLPLISFFTHYMFRPLRAILKWDIQLVIISVF
jgi:hypothetical protein